jgi:hypothetical protein
MLNPNVKVQMSNQIQSSKVKKRFGFWILTLIWNNLDFEI